MIAKDLDGSVSLMLVKAEQADKLRSRINDLTSGGDPSFLGESLLKEVIKEGRTSLAIKAERDLIELLAPPQAAQPEPPAAPPKRVQRRPDGFPRRNDLLLNTPAEMAIRAAISAVEEAGAHPLLTDAVVLLDEARDKVADFVELPPPPAPPLPRVCRHCGRNP